MTPLVARAPRVATGGPRLPACPYRTVAAGRALLGRRAMGICGQCAIVVPSAGRHPCRDPAVRQPLIGTATLVLAVLGARGAIGQLALPTLLALGCDITIGAVTYVGYLIVVDRDGLAEVRQVLEDFGVPARQLNRWPFARGTR